MKDFFGRLSYSSAAIPDDYVAPGGMLLSNFQDACAAFGMESALRKMPNVHLSSHIAGSFNDEVHRMADYMIEDFQRWQDSEELKYAVNPQELMTRA